MMIPIRNVVYFEADADEDDDGAAIVYLVAVQEGGEYVRIQLRPDQAEELASLLMEAVESARREGARCSSSGPSAPAAWSGASASPTRGRPGARSPG